MSEEPPTTTTAAQPIPPQADGAALWEGFESIGVPVMLVVALVAVFDLFRRASGA